MKGKLRTNDMNLVVAGDEPWMATYADLMSLLLCFFILLFSISRIDEAGEEEVKKSFVQSFGSEEEAVVGEWGITDTSNIISNSFSTLANWLELSANQQEAMEMVEKAAKSIEEEKKIKKYLHDTLKKKGIYRHLKKDAGQGDPNMLTLSFNAERFFSTQGSDLKEEAYQLLTPLLEETKKLDGIIDVKVTSIVHYRKGKNAPDFSLSSMRAAKIAETFQGEKTKIGLVTATGQNMEESDSGPLEQPLPNDRVTIIFQKRVNP